MSYLDWFKGLFRKNILVKKDSTIESQKPFVYIPKKHYEELLAKVNSNNFQIESINIPKGGLLILKVGDKEHEPTSQTLQKDVDNLAKGLKSFSKKNNYKVLAMPYYNSIELISSIKKVKE